jgi:hypothetical protein
MKRSMIKKFNGKGYVARILSDSVDDVNLIKESPSGIIGKVYLVGLS